MKRVFVPPIKSQGIKTKLVDWISSNTWKDCNISTKEHFYHVGANENNRNAVYEALLTNFKLPESIGNQEMKMRIELNESQLTTKKEGYVIPMQTSMTFEEVKAANTRL